VQRYSKSQRIAGHKSRVSACGTRGCRRRRRTRHVVKRWARPVGTRALRRPRP